MFLFIIEFLHSFFGIKIPTVFSYTSTRMALSALTAVLITIFLGKGFIKKLYELKIGDRVRKEDCPLLGELHRNKNETPTMGGLLILFSIVVSLFFWMDLKSPFTLLLLFTTVSVGAIGFTDDFLKLVRKNTKGLSGKKKLFFQILISLCISAYLLYPPLTEFIHSGAFFPPIEAKFGQNGVQSTQEYALSLFVPFIKQGFHFSGMLAITLMTLFFIFVITGSSNAVNLTDGLDGLASGCVIFSAATFAFIAFISNNLLLSSYLNIPYIENSGEIAIFMAATLGACLGFLWYNGYPAQVFMGDTGSLALGGILGVTAVLLKKELLFGIVGGIFVLEALSVILQVGSYKLRNKKRIFLCTPLHHHFEYKGWSEPKVVLRFWIFALFFAILGMVSLKFQ